MKIELIQVDRRSFISEIESNDEIKRLTIWLSTESCPCMFFKTQLRKDADTLKLESLGRTRLSSAEAGSEALLFP